MVNVQPALFLDSNFETFDVTAQFEDSTGAKDISLKWASLLTRYKVYNFSP